MPTPLSERQVIEYVTTLEADYGVKRKEEIDRLKLYGLYATPNLPRTIQRGNQVNVLSPALIEASHSIISDLLPMITEVQVLPQARDEHGMIPEADKRKADAEEHSLAIILDGVDHDRRLSRNMIWRQLNQPVGIFVAECKEIDLPLRAGMTASDYAAAEKAYKASRFMWTASDIDPLGASWMEKDGVPTVMGRRFKQSILKTQRDFTGARTPNGRNGAVSINGGKWGVEALSDDYAPVAVNRTPSFLNLPIPQGLPGSAKSITATDMLWLSDKDFTYIVALDDGNKDGKMLWWAPNPLGRCAAFLVPGNETPLRTPEDRYEPYLYSLMVYVRELNMIRTIRATASRNRADQQAYAPLDPDTVRELKAAGFDLPTYIKFGSNGEIPYVASQKILEREVLVDPDLDRLEASIKLDFDRVMPQAASALSDPSVLKEATAAALLNAAETAMRKLGPLVTGYDSAKRQLLEAIEHSVRTAYKGEYGSFLLLGAGDGPYRAASARNNKPKSQAFVFDAESIDFPHKIVLGTKMMSQGQAAAAYEYRANQRDRGDATNAMVLEAANITDPEQFLFDKAKEEIVQDPALVAFRNQMVQAAFAEEVYLELHITLPGTDPTGMLGQQSAEGQQQQQQANGTPPPPPNVPAPPAGAPKHVLAGNQTNAPTVPGPPSATQGTNGGPP